MSDPKTERPELPTRLIQADWDYADAAEKERNEGPNSLSRPNSMVIELRSAWAFTHAAERERDAETALRQQAEDGIRRLNVSMEEYERRYYLTLDRAEAAEQALAASPALTGLRAALEAVKGLRDKLYDNDYRGVQEATLDFFEEAIQRLIDAEGK